jgi:hypothetical protein
MPRWRILRPGYLGTEADRATFRTSRCVGEGRTGVRDPRDFDCGGPGPILQFADFTRHSFQRAGSYTTLEDELWSNERHLALEQARFGDRLGVSQPTDAVPTRQNHGPAELGWEAGLGCEGQPVAERRRES